MSYDTLINEPISVWVFFDPSTGHSTQRVSDSMSSRQTWGIFPIAMNWRRRLVKFQKLIFASTRRVGQVKIINLVCSSDTSNFELEYNSENHIWKLTKIMPRE